MCLQQPLLPPPNSPLTLFGSFNPPRKNGEKLDSTIKRQFQKKLAERLNGEPRIPSAALFNMPDCYKIKLRKAGYRLVYRVEDEIVTVTVIAVGTHDRNEIYKEAMGRQ